jgi:uncharacterized MnhB-related membrane protein
MTTTDPTRKYALAAGICYLLTFASSIPALALIGPVLHDANYIVGSGDDTRVLWGCLLDLVNALTAIGTAVAVFPVVRRENEALALGFVTSRMFEAAVIVIGVVSLLAIVTLRQDQAGDVATGQALVAVRNWTFLLGPGLMPVFNAVFLGTLMYRSRLVPRIIPTVGLIGAPILLALAVATFFGHNTQTSTLSFVGTLPIAAWELSVGLWMAIKGFNRGSVVAPRRGA